MSLATMNMDIRPDELSDTACRATLAEMLYSHISMNYLRYYPELEGLDPVSISRVSEARMRLYSLIYEYGLAAGQRSATRSIIAKVRRVPRIAGLAQSILSGEASTLAWKEYDFHTQVYGYFSANLEGFKVVRPLDYIADINAILVEKAEGEDLGFMIQSARRSLRRTNEEWRYLGETFYRCGKWLRHFHQGVGKPEVCPFQPEELISRVERYHQRLGSSGAPPDLTAPYRDQIVRLVMNVRKGSVTRSCLHGDFKLRHIWASPDAITVLDFGNRLEGTTFDDIARFLVEIRLLDFGFRLPLAARLSPVLSERFLEGYFGTDDWSPLLRLYFVVWLWVKWSRRLKKFAHNRAAKKIEAGIRRLGVRQSPLAGYVHTWFERELTAHLELLENSFDGLRGGAGGLV